MRARTIVAGVAIALAAGIAGLVRAASGRIDPNALRNQGEACASCHKPDGKAPRALFTVGGTIFRSSDGEPRETGAGGVAIELIDAAGRRVALTSNAAGNFWSKDPVSFPVQVSVRTLPEGAPRVGPPGRCAHGDCNQCHAYEQPRGPAHGRLVRP